MASDGSTRVRDCFFRSCASDACSMCVRCVARCCCCSCLFLFPLFAECASISATHTGNFGRIFLQAQQQECRTAKRGRREHQMRQQVA